MDDFGSVIYIVFTIIAIVFSIIKKANKVKDQNSQSPQTRKDTTHKGFPDFETLFEDTEEMEEEVISDQPSVKIETVPSKQIQPKPVSNDFQEKVKEMERKYSRKAKKSKTKKEPEMCLVEDKEGDNFAFNLREAVIYSEILKRPDF